MNYLKVDKPKCMAGIDRDDGTVVLSFRKMDADCNETVIFLAQFSHVEAEVLAHSILMEASRAKLFHHRQMMSMKESDRKMLEESNAEIERSRELRERLEKEYE